MRPQMKQLYRLLLFASLTLISLPANTWAQSPNFYILQSPNLADAQAACQNYGFTMVSTVHAPDTFLVAAGPGYTLDQLKAWTQGDPNVKNIDINHNLSVPETTQLATASSPSVPLTTSVSDNNLIKLYGSNVWAAYVQQGAYYSTNAYNVVKDLKPLNQLNPNDNNPSNRPIVIAVIDTGIDQLNPVLAPYVVQGFDFTRNTPGFASDVADLNQSTVAILEQSTAAILENYQIAVLNQSTAAILEQSTVAMLEGNRLPAYFGHGTMVAGLIHLVAPNSQLMPLKAFAADGTGSEANIIKAIYYAVDHKATVINMSFELPQISDALMKAINYATRNGVICVASAGNDAATALVYPAGFGNVVSVGSVSPLGEQSTFSNYGPDLVQIAAPGEGLITTYPGNHYAQVWGTSFSAALVSGTASVLFQQTNNNITNQILVGDIQRALSNATACGTNGSLGAGCLDLNQAVQFIKSMNMQQRTKQRGNNWNRPQ
jgi:subtilisin family serine protease